MKQDRRAPTFDPEWMPERIERLKQKAAEEDAVIFELFVDPDRGVVSVVVVGAHYCQQETFPIDWLAENSSAKLSNYRAAPRRNLFPD